MWHSLWRADWLREVVVFGWISWCIYVDLFGAVFLSHWYTISWKWNLNYFENKCDDSIQNTRKWGTAKKETRRIVLCSGPLPTLKLYFCHQYLSISVLFSIEHTDNIKIAVAKTINAHPTLQAVLNLYVHKLTQNTVSFWKMWYSHHLSSPSDISYKYKQKGKCCHWEDFYCEFYCASTHFENAWSVIIGLQWPQRWQVLEFFRE